MKKNGFKSFAIAALAALATPVAALAAGGEGDICSIQAVPVDYYGTTGNALSPHWVGDTLYICVRLLNEQWGDYLQPGWDKTKPCHEWVLERNGVPITTSSTMEEVVYRPALRIAIGSKIVSAQLGEGPNFETSGCNPDFPIYTDLYFSYKVQQGELGLPVRLVNADGEIIDSSDAVGANGFSFLNVRTAMSSYGYWDLTNDLRLPLETDTHLANFKFGPALASMTGNPMGKVGYPGYDEKRQETWPQNSINVVYPGIYVQAIDFEAHEGNWCVSEEGPDPSRKRPAVTGAGPATVYLWSDDESVMVPYGDEEPSVTDRTVIKVRLNADGSPVAFGMKAAPGAAVGSTARICMCSQPNPAKNAQGDELSGSYVTAMVEVIAPPPPSIRLSWDKTGEGGVYPDIVPTYTNDLSEVAELGYPIDIELSEAFGEEVTLVLAARHQAAPDDAEFVYTNDLIGTAVTDAGDIPNSFVTPPAVTEIKFKATEIAKRVWVYPVGSLSKAASKGDTVNFSVSFKAGTSAAVVSKYTNEGLCTLRVVDPKPAVLAPTAADAITVGEPITVTVAESYRDRTAPRSLKVQVLNGTTELYSSNIVFTAKGQTPADTVEVELDTAAVLAKLQRDEPRTVPITVKVTDPLSQIGTSAAFELAVPAKEQAKTVSAVLYDGTTEGSRHEGSEFAEGQEPKLRFVLSEALEVGNDLYAFLVPQDETSSNLVDCAAFTEGVLIAGGSTNSTLAIKYRLTLKDGCDLTDGTSGQLRYKIVLRTDKDPTKGNADTTFTDTKGLQLTVANVNTEAQALYVNGSPMPTEDGGKYETEVASGSEQSFVASYGEVSHVDQTNGIVTVWCFTDGRLSNTFKYSCVTSTADTVECRHTFSYAGGSDQKVMFVPVDKDLLKSLIGDKALAEGDLKTLWPSLVKVVAPYTISVHVGEAKHIVVTPDTLTMTENDTTSKILLSLSNPNDSGASYWMRVRISTLNPDSDKPGAAPLAAEVLEIKPNAAEPAKSTAYNGGLKFEYKKLDGSATSAGDGFYVEVALYETKADAEAADTGDAFLSDEGEVTEYERGEAYVYVLNIPPTISPPEPANMTTNTTVALGQEFSIAGWSASDVATDFDKVKKIGLECKWYIDDNLQNDLTTTVYEKTSQTTSGFKFTSEGFHEVRLEVTDKDGEDADGKATRRWFYYIAPTKRIEVTPYGPGVISSMVSKYGTADGLGKGRVYAEAANTVVSEFTYSFNCNVSMNELTLYAFGYPAAESAAGYPDDGTLVDSGLLTGRDLAISEVGNSTLAAPYFTYGVTKQSTTNEWELDNYFYCWINSGDGDKKALGEKFDGIPKPATVANVATKVTANLDPYEAKKDSYMKREVEVIFSREWRKADNGGDINADGVPDIYMLKEWKGGKLLELVYGDAVGNVADLRDLAQTNPDGDYLPGVMLKEGELGLVEGAQKSYAPVGRPFVTRDELRGFGDGLNAQDLLTSDPDFSEDEQKAWVAWLKAQGEEVDENNPPPGDLSRWSPEPKGEFPRMDPTMADTDGDGYDDGWEYYFWYLAHVQVPAGTAKPVKGQQAVFERFDPERFIYGIAITNMTEVENQFNPLVKREKKAVGTDEDFDNDGLSDYEEYLLGTNPCHWDTDGDHMCDAWEVMMCLDPLGKSDKTGNPDGDFMAALNLMGFPAVFVDKDTDPWGEDAWYFDIYGYLIPGIDYDPFYMIVLRDTPEQIPVLRFVPLTVEDVDADGNPTNVPALYGRADDIPEPDEEAENPLAALMDTIWGYQLGKTPEPPPYGPGWIIGYSYKEGQELADTNAFVMIHDQILGAFGFDPRTGWNMNANGYVDVRWEEVPMDATGVAVNTMPYLTYDEYLLGTYRQLVGVRYPGEKPVDPAKDPFGFIRSKTTNPNVVYTVGETSSTDTNGVTTTTSTTNFTGVAGISKAVAEAFGAAGGKHSVITSHGADTDGDGVPDGWELYVKRNPSAAYGDEENPFMPYIGLMLAGDVEDDGLTLAMEFAGTDSCNAYKDCESIYKNHPGERKGWYNKFFPTDPDNGDTDGDGIADGKEGMTWIGAYKDATGVSADEIFTAIYGKPADDGSQCIRGGGLNPLTVDTDLDGLPDAWEMAFAGLPVDLTTKSYLNPEKPEYIKGELEVRTDPEIDDAKLVAAGIYNKDFTSGAILLDGMDPTWGGDGFTDPFDQPESRSHSFDEVTGTLRDVDYDHDGLQNWQEYLVQTVRHFRYDDITTPLMGRVFYEARRDPFTGALLEDHRQVFMGFTPMQGEYYNMAYEAAMRWPSDGEAVFVQTNLTGVIVSTNKFTGVVSTNYTHEIVKKISPNAEVVYAHMAYDGGGLFSYYYSMPWCDEAFKLLGYMTPVPNSWDRFGANPTIPYPYLLYPPAGWFSTDPREADTDGDGMDDYYEMFHGLNPILGGVDVIAQGYGAPLTFNAYWNEWTHPDFDRDIALFGFPGSNRRMEEMPAPMRFDPVMYPWAVGSADADPDGDGIRNDEERILANVTSPLPSHTDPTPMWMTDAGTPKSFTAQYYLNSFPATTLPFYPANYAIEDEPYFDKSLKEVNQDYVYSFEQNEGYDTDNDWIADGREITKTVRSASSPLKFSDPDRRQAVYFPGRDAYLMTRDLQTRGVDAADMLKQFTVECWVRPESRGKDQTVIERSTYYGGDAVTKLGGVIRANFRIGMSADGRVYGMFDNNDAIESGLNQPVSCQRVDGLVLPLGKWSHVALTYDGKRLVLYVNSQVASEAETSLTPATGVSSILQDPLNTGRFPGYQYAALPMALFVGARPTHVKRLANRPFPLIFSAASFDTMREYFHGYVDEVRVWDGARTSVEIAQNYRKRLSFADVAANRTSVYQSWAAENPGTRNDNDGHPTLPAELIHHYNFVTLPGAVKEGDVALTPGGFDSAVDAQAENGYKKIKYPDMDLTGLTDPKGLKGVPGSYELKDGIKVSWWDASAVKSTVYADTRVVPWIENTVGHLPYMDGSTVDSQAWAEALYGFYTPSTIHGYAKFAFPNEANPYQDIVYSLEHYLRLFQMKRLVDELGESYESLRSLYQYEVRSRFQGTSDLLPLGGAYAKTCPEMWDDGSAADAWEQTGKDANDVGLPDWWTRYVRENYCEDLPPQTKIGWDTEVDYFGLKIAAYQAYLIDLARGMQPDGTYDATYAAKADTDGDNIPDWWERIWGVSEYGADDDPDNDGLSNYAEYVLSFGNLLDPTSPYGLENGFPLLDPTRARSGKDQLVIDYFLPGPTNAEAIAGNAYVDAAGKFLLHFNSHEYLGEIATDHDFMESWWEKQYKNHFVNSGVYDPQLDTDQDGWSNYAECRAALWCGNYVADLIDRYLDGDMHFACYPEPAIGVKPFYYGAKDVKGVPLVVRTWTGVSPRVDATFVVPHEANGATKVIGGFRTATVMRGFMSPGSVLPSSVVLEKALTTSDKTYKWSWQWYVENDKNAGSAAATDWATMPTSGTFEEYQALFLQYPHIELTGGDLEWIAFATSVSDSMGKTAKIVHSQTAAEIGTIDLRTGEWALDTGKLAACDEDGAKLDSCLLRITYSSQIGEEWPQAVWLSDTQEFGSGAVQGKGRVKQGVNTVEAFFDFSGDGKWQPGEPYGVVRNVEIGWHKVPELAIELKDEGVAMTRQSLGGGSGEAQFVIRRVTVNGDSQINDVTVPQRQLATRTVVLDDRAYLTEADILSGDVCDLDWKWLVTDATEKLGLELKDIRTVGYAVERVTKGADGRTSNGVVGLFTRQFNTQRSKPVVKAPAQDKPVYAARPTFAFSSSDETMTAYEIQVFAENGVDKVWDSGVQPLPARQGLGVGEYAYTVTPALYADCAVSTNGSKVFFDGSNYVWRVALMNAKFNDTSDPACWSEFGKFQMDVGNENRYPKFPTGYGSVAAAVRYYGPTNAVAGAIVVEAFENADFTGAPVARTRVADVSLVDSIADITTTNAFLCGIEPGTVYLRAYIDQNNNGKRDSWESWGYLNSVGESVAAIYNPVGAEVVDSLVQFPTCTIYIEDCDLNGNEIPDCLESEKFTGGGESSGALDGDKDGLTDDEENGFGTDPTLWDTDGDGMPDGWEMNFAGLDPRFYDADEVTDGDWMAYAEVEATFVTVQNTDDPTDVTVYVLGEDVAKRPVRGDTAVGLPLFATYAYEVSVGGELQDRVGLGTNVTLVAEAGKLYRVAQVADGKVALVHAQVYDAFGFEPWCATGNAAPAETADAHTKPFTALDKYLVVRYLEANGLANEETMNLNLTPGQQWKNLTLKPLDVDNDRDGIADGWELYVMFGTNGCGSCTLAEAKVSPWNYNDARTASPDGDDLLLLDEFAQGVAPTDPWNVNTVLDDVADSIVHEFNLGTAESQLGDDDDDGLSNWAEYLATEVYGFGTFRVDDAYSAATNVLDYFVVVTNGPYAGWYVGEVVADHDFLVDTWEDAFDVEYVNRNVYDAWGDGDDDGWSNWSEARAGTDPTSYGRLSLVRADGSENNVVDEFPVPRIRMTVSYDSDKPFVAPLVVKAWKGGSMNGAADAVWNVAGATDEVAGGEQSQIVEQTRFIGLNPGKKVFLNIGPGAIAEGHVKLEFYDPRYSTENMTVTTNEQSNWFWWNGRKWTHTYTYHTIDSSNWTGGNWWPDFPQDKRFGPTTGVIKHGSEDLVSGGSTDDTSYEVVGSVDYKTGDVMIDFTSPSLSSTEFVSGAPTGDDTYVRDHYNEVRAYWRISWVSKLISGGKVKSFTLGKPNELSADTFGHLSEGLNTFIAFADLDGNGEWDEGEPFGIARNVDVGWDHTSVAIELTDESAAFKRLSVGSYPVWVDTNAVDAADVAAGAVTSAVRRVRVMRTSINEQTLDRPRMVFSRSIDLGVRDWLAETDFIRSGHWDFDDRYLLLDAQGANIAAENVRTAEYAIYVGEGSVSEMTPAATWQKRFTGNRVAPTVVSPSTNSYYRLLTAQPTLCWKGPDGYTAFSLQIATNAEFKASDVIYAVTNFLPAATEDGYSFKAPVYVGKELTDKTTYWWRVCELNAKFTEPGDWSDPASFKTAIDSTDADTGYGPLAAHVRYYGPATNSLAQVIVGVYGSADFTGDPVAKRILGAAEEGVSSLAYVAEEGVDYMKALANVTFDGIAPGTYYVMAFIDANGNGVRDPFETWGYANGIGSAPNGAFYEPAGVRVVSNKANVPTVVLFMEDTDCNQEGGPDCLEDPSLFATHGAASVDGLDSDRDGLTDDEELNDTGTDEFVWDTDDDGMPDGWEARFAETDPLNADADYAEPGDVMAYAVSNMTAITLWDGANEASATNVYVTSRDAKVYVGDSVGGLSLYTTYAYGEQTGLGAPVTADVSALKVYSIATNAPIVLVHAQVYDAFGFDPLTANPALGEESWGLHRTKAFTALDKYLVVRYLQSYGLADEIVMNTNRSWSAYTLKPADPDNDRDGVADGWELYVMFGTNEVKTAATKRFSPWNYDDARDMALDFDCDGLAALGEYNEGDIRTDPWNAGSMYDYLREQGLLYPGTPEFDDSVARDFGLAAGLLDEDDDLDLITAGQEMQGYYLDPTALADLDPANAWSNGGTNDYFRVCGSKYLGELFNGAEFIEPSVRKAMNILTLPRSGTRDYRESGWDAWSTARFSVLNAEETLDVDGVVSDELMLLIRYWNVIRPGEFTGTTVGEAMDFFHEIWKGVTRLIDADGNVLIEAHDAGVAGPGTIHDADAAQTTTQVVAFFGGQAKIEDVILRNKKDITANQIVTPEPTINLLLKYAGNESYNIVLEAYQTSLAYPEYGEQMTAQWTTPAKFDSGLAKINAIRTSGLGSLKQGLTRFVAYIDADGDGKLSAGDTSGECTMEVGYLGCDVTIALGEANPALPALRLTDGSNTCSTVALVRSAINGKPLYNSAKGVYIVQFPNNAARESLYPAEYDSGNYIGIDSTLSSLENVGEIESVTYEVLRLSADEVSGLSITNLNNYILVTSVETNDTVEITSNVVNQALNETVTIRYSIDRDVAKSISCAGSTADDFTLTFTVPTDTANTKFWLNVQTNGAEAATLFGGEKGFILNDVRKGVVVLDKAWFEANRIAIPTGKTKFGVVLGNDKFGRPSPATCAMAETVINEGASFDGRLAVTVEHPTAELDAKLTVAVYEKADFANPVVWTNGCAAGETIELAGLRPNAEYYVAAWYVDNAADGRGRATRRMPYDTWGYLTMIGEAANGFEAKAVKAELIPVSTNTVWLQDTDYNDNNVIDREEDILVINGEYACSVDPIYGFEIQGVEEAEIFSDAKENDVFAYAEIPFFCVMTEVGGAETWFAVTDLAAEKLSDKTTPGIPVGASLSNIVSLATTYLYDFGKSNAKRLGLGTNVVWTGAEKVMKVVEQKPLILVHAQVYDRFGFNPNTANGRIEKAAWVNSRAFTSADKMYVTNYLANVLGWTGDVSQFALPIDYPDADEVADGRGDGILDGWELYVKHSPWNYDDRLSDVDGDGLDQLHEYDGGHLPTDPWDLDTDDDGVLDLFAQRYHLKGDESGSDLDGDGLSNYAEYLITEVFKLATVDPAMSHTSEGILDYYRKVGELYLGELFTDHDQMNDLTEDAVGSNVINRAVYDANRDGVGEGWSNWATVSAYEAWTGTNAFTRVSPEIRLTLSYLGSQLPAGAAATVTVKTYSDGPKMLVCDAVYQLTNVVRGVNSLTLTEADLVSGAPKEGKTWIMATLAAGAGEPTSAGAGGETANAAVTPMGFAVADIGWAKPAVRIEVTDVTAVGDRIDAYAGTSMRQALQGVADASALPTDDPMTPDVDESSWAEESTATAARERVRIVPYAVRGTTQDQSEIVGQIEDDVSLLSLAELRVAADFYIDRQNHPFISEADFIDEASGVFDLDWKTFVAFDTTAIENAVGDITLVKYRVIFGEEPFLGPQSNLDTTWTNTPNKVRLLGIPLERRFEARAARTPSVAVSPLDGGKVYAARPTFKWRLDEPDRVTRGCGSSYTAFNLKILTEDKKTVFESGMRRAPAKDAEGNFAWTGPVLAPGNYLWQVEMFNAKYQKPTFGMASTLAEFSMATGIQQDMNDHNYGAIDVAVKYAGPANVLTKGIVRVQAFDTPDFSGEPLSETVLTNNAQATTLADALPNCRLAGLPMNGTYYVRAFIDTQADGQRAAWESWGSYKLANVDTLAAPVKLSGVTSPVVGVFIEDCDTDQDWLPDAWEMVMNGSLSAQGAEVDPESKIVFRGNTYEGIAGISSGLKGATLTVFNNLSVAAQMLGLSGETSIAAINAAVQKQIVKNSVKITSMTFDQAKGKIELTVDAEVAASVAGQLLSKWYTIDSPEEVEVTVKVFKVDSLGKNWPTEPEVTKTVKFGKDAQTVTVDLGGGDYTSGFFKVEVVQ